MKLVFVHGAGSWGGVWWKQLGHVKDAEAVTLPGHPEGELPGSVEEYADWLYEYINSRCYKDVVLAGHSLGGAIVMLYALKYPQDLKGVILVGTGARLRVSPVYLSELEEALKGDMASWVRRMREHYGKLDLVEREDLVRKHLEIGPLAQLNDLLCCDRFDVMDRVQELKVPALIVCGDEDVMTPLKFADYLESQIPEAKKVVLEGATHHLFLEKPGEFNRVISEFIDSLVK